MSDAPADIVAAGAAARARIRTMTLDVRWFDSVSSTMDVASAAAGEGAAEGLVVAAGRQTAGRGRRGRSWSSPPDAGLYVSFVLRPPSSEMSGPLSLLTLAAGVAVLEAIAGATGLPTILKWPNDVMVGRRKLAGILAEGVGIGTAVQTIVLGVGVNLGRADRPLAIGDRITSIEEELGRSVDRAPLFEELLTQIAHVYERLRRGQADDILRAWREASPSAAGMTVEWEAGGIVSRGTTAGVDRDGALLVKGAAGDLTRVVAGEVRWI